MPAIVKAKLTYSGIEGFFLNGSTFEVATLERANELASRGLVEIIETWGGDEDMLSRRVTRPVYESEMRQAVDQAPTPGNSPSTPPGQTQGFEIQITEEPRMVNRTEPPQTGVRGEEEASVGGQAKSAQSNSLNIRFTGEEETDIQNQAGSMEDMEPAQFDDVVKSLGGGWYQLPNGERIQGKETAREVFETYVRGGE